MERWFFSTHENVVHLQARGEGEGGLVGDFHQEVRPGESLGNVCLRK